MLDQPGIEIRPPDIHVRVEWKNLLFNLGEVLVHGFLAVPTAGATVPSAITSSFAAIASLGTTEPIESRAYALIALSFAYAIDKLRPDFPNGMPPDISKEIGISMQEAVETGRHILQPNFLEFPLQFSLYKACRPMLVSALAGLRPDATSVAAKLDAAFAAAVYKVLSIKPEYFSPIITALSNPAFDSANREFQWAGYRAKLIESFEVDPVFGQDASKVSLSQLYVPCLASWFETRDENDQVPIYGDLFDTILKWVENRSNEDNIRVIAGGPGSGKSSLAKYLSFYLAKIPNYRPIFIELQKIGNFVDLQGAIQRRLVNELELFSQDPLEDKNESRPYILIFDGLDELVVPGGDAASRTAESFASSLKSLLRALNGQGKGRAKALVTGRTAIAQAFDEAALTQVPQAKLDILGFVGTTSSDYDLRPIWWSQYSRAFNLSQELPIAYSSERLVSITNEPLLCYLLALSGYALDGWEEVADNHNKIFDKLLGEVWERKWGRENNLTSGRVGPALALDRRSEFDLLMETVALAAWWAGENRVATKTAFDRALEIVGSKTAWEKFRHDNGEEIGNLALTFYFKRSEIGSQGIEFTHKSFGEYLVARFLMRTLSNKICSPLKIDAIELSEAADRWVKVASDAPITNDIRPFLENEARLLQAHELAGAGEQLGRLIAKIIPTGLDTRKIHTGSLRELFNRSNIGIINLNIISEYVNSSGDNIIIPRDWHNYDDVTNMVRDISSYYVHVRNPTPSFVRMNLKNVFLNGAFLLGFDFSHANLDSANFVSCNAGAANFIGSDLTASSFSNASLQNANFTGAILSGVCFSNAFIDSAIFDFDWLNYLDPRTFTDLPIGDPLIRLKTGQIVQPGQSGYPNIKNAYARMLKRFKEDKLKRPPRTFYGE